LFPAEEPKTHQADTEDLQALRWTTAHLQRSQAEAIELAQQFLGSSSRTRGNHNEPTYTVDYVLSSSLTPATRGTGATPFADTLLYILNSSNGKGSALVAGDRRVGDLLAILDTGDFDLADTSVASSGISVFLSRLPGYFKQQLATFEEALSVGGKPAVMRDIEIDDGPSTAPSYYLTPRYGPWTTTSYIEPLCPVTWRQGLPYNNQTPTIDGEHAQAGCVAVAIAQLLATYHRNGTKPNAHFDLNWPLLIKYPSDVGYKKAIEKSMGKPEHRKNEEELDKFVADVSRLHRLIGNHIKMNWGLERSGASTVEAVKFLQRYGISYYYPKWYTLYYVQDGLMLGFPAIMEGFAEKTEHGFWFITWETYDAGHAWLADGILIRSRTVEYIRSDNGRVESSKTQTHKLVHCNWGWRGLYNGYFFSGIFDAYHPVIESSSLTGREGFYQYQVKCSSYNH